MTLHVFKKKNKGESRKERKRKEEQQRKERGDSKRSEVIKWAFPFISLPGSGARGENKLPVRKKRRKSEKKKKRPEELAIARKYRNKGGR